MNQFKKHWKFNVVDHDVEDLKMFGSLNFLNRSHVSVTVLCLASYIARTFELYGRDSDKSRTQSKLHCFTCRDEKRW